MTTGYGSGMCMGFVTHAHLTGPKKIKKLVRECRYLTSRLTPYLVRVPTRPNFKKKEKTFLDGGRAEAAGTGATQKGIFT